jgi:L-cysteine:1D-myo-inositol 2-amino-2-deoxy-alpha-D-glucopyranoside ligase
MQLYNTETGRLERFTARDGKVGMYVCGVTPYDTTHVGHAFTFLTFDILVRLLRHKGFDVTYVQNVTDVDEPLFVKANELGISWEELGTRETQKFLEDMQALNWVEPDHYVKATESIPYMLPIIQALLDKGYAYAAGGNVYFSVDADPEFGKLSHIPRDRMLPIANERGNTPNDPNKRNPLDFVLWQTSKPGEPVWESPFGPGRPGWHIECSAMSSEFLGPSIDIHGGGTDLIFPHHEAEVAQSENAFDVEPFARYWVHVGTVDYQGEKMSKSLGNLVFVSDLLKIADPRAIRLALMRHHYRSGFEWHDTDLEEGNALLHRLVAAAACPGGADPRPFAARVRAAIDDDLDAPRALEALDDLASAVLSGGVDPSAPDTLRELGALLGIDLAQSL